MLVSRPVSTMIVSSIITGSVVSATNSGDSSQMDSEVNSVMSAPLGMIDDRRPENVNFGTSAPAVPSVFAFSAVGGGSIWPDCTLFVRVLGVANRDILKVLAFGVTTNVDVDLVGEPASVTLVGDCGRRAGDRRSDALKGDDVSAAFTPGSDSLKGDRSIESPKPARCGDVFNPSLNGD